MTTKTFTAEEINELKVLSAKFQDSYTNLGILSHKKNQLEAELLIIKDQKKNIYSNLELISQSQRGFEEKIIAKYGDGRFDSNTGTYITNDS